MWQLTCWQIFFSFCIYKTLQGRVELSQIFVFYPQRNIYWWGIHGTMMADTLFHPPPQSPNLSNQSQKLCYEEAIKLNIRPNTCRLADCFPGHKGCFITNVLMFGMEKLLYQISEFISLQTRFLSNKRAINYTLIHVGLITAY